LWRIKLIISTIFFKHHEYLHHSARLLLPSYPEGDDISGFLKPDDLMTCSLGPTRDVFLSGRIVCFHFQDLTHLNVLNLFLGLRDGHGAKEAHAVKLSIMS
jgi:hypothetical protein